MFDQIFNWKLLKGSHEFPGPDGGTCINEAAIIAAGLKYRKVESVADCPPCFSRPIAAYALGLNDNMPDTIRQALLMPFVVRLAGTKAGATIERKRTDFIAIETVRSILPLILTPKLAEQCRAAVTLLEARTAARHALDVTRARLTSGDLRFHATHSTYATKKAQVMASCASAWSTTTDAGDCRVSRMAADTVTRVACLSNPSGEVFQIACGILDQAILLGNHTEIEFFDALPRLEKAKQLA